MTCKNTWFFNHQIQILVLVVQLTAQLCDFKPWPMFSIASCNLSSLQWRHNERGGVSNDRCLDCLLNRLFRRRSKKTSASPVTDGFPSQKPVTRKMVSILWRHHDNGSLHIGNLRNILLETLIDLYVDYLARLRWPIHFRFGWISAWEVD